MYTYRSIRTHVRMDSALAYIRMCTIHTQILIIYTHRIHQDSQWLHLASEVGLPTTDIITHDTERDMSIPKIQVVFQPMIWSLVFISSILHCVALWSESDQGIATDMIVFSYWDVFHECPCSCLLKIFHDSRLIQGERLPKPATKCTPCETSMRTSSRLVLSAIMCSIDCTLMASLHSCGVAIWSTMEGSPWWSMGDGATSQPMRGAFLSSS